EVAKVGGEVRPGAAHHTKGDHNESGPEHCARAPTAAFQEEVATNPLPDPSKPLVTDMRKSCSTTARPFSSTVWRCASLPSSSTFAGILSERRSLPVDDAKIEIRWLERTPSGISLPRIGEREDLPRCHN